MTMTEQYLEWVRLMDLDKEKAKIRLEMGAKNRALKIELAKMRVLAESLERERLRLSQKCIDLHIENDAMRFDKNRLIAKFRELFCDD